MLHSAVILLLLLAGQGTPVDLWRTDFDPFTDKADFGLEGIGKYDEIKLKVVCSGDGDGLSFAFHTEQSVGWFPETDGEKGIGSGRGLLRFDDGPAETFRFRGMGLGMMFVGWRHEDGRFVIGDDGDLLVRRFPDHDKLRISIAAYRSGDKFGFRHVVEEFDISRVDLETLEYMAALNCTLTEP